KPEMSAKQAADLFVDNWKATDYRFGLINFANPDMVGHSGVIPAVVDAVEATDTELARVVEVVHSKGGVCVITADHGNAEQLLEPDGSPNTAHSLNPVPLIVTKEGLKLRDQGILADVTPTVLDLLGIDQPPEMTGQSMIVTPQ
ncbi:MAG: 2,3-bisphosphoglycerate-independent phosphoglycerate mutase, partial [Solirubrobacterales bacterium]